MEYELHRVNANLYMLRYVSEHDDPTADLAASASRDPNGYGSALERLRQMILSGEIPPGAVVSQLQLARQLGVSTTPLREAMRQLQAEGLLETQRRNQRPRVPKLDVEDLHGVYAMRVMLESLAIALTVEQAQPSDLDDLDDALRGMRAAGDEHDLETWETIHRRFHRQLVAGAPPALMPTISNFLDRSERYRLLSVRRNDRPAWSNADVDHERIVAACHARDGAAAAHELANHLARTAIGLSAVFAPEIDPTPVRTALRLVIDPEQANGKSRR